MCNSYFEVWISCIFILKKEQQSPKCKLNQMAHIIVSEFNTSVNCFVTCRREKQQTTTLKKQHREGKRLAMEVTGPWLVAGM